MSAHRWAQAWSGIGICKHCGIPLLEHGPDGWIEQHACCSGWSDHEHSGWCRAQELADDEHQRMAGEAAAEARFVADHDPDSLLAR